jgi:hypothetical protein
MYTMKGQYFVRLYVKITRKIAPLHSMKAYVGVEVWRHILEGSCQLHARSASSKPYGGPKNIRHFCKKFSRQGVLVLGICAPLVLQFYVRITNRTENAAGISRTFVTEQHGQIQLRWACLSFEVQLKVKFSLCSTP